MFSRTKPDGPAASRRWLGLTLFALLASLAGLGAVTSLSEAAARRTQADLARQTALASRARRIQATLLSLVDAETGQRGYLLTGNDRYLAPYRSAVRIECEQALA